MFGFGIGGAWSLRGEAGRAGIGREVEEAGWAGRSCFSFGFVMLAKVGDCKSEEYIGTRKVGPYWACCLLSAYSFSAKSVGWGAWRSLPFLEGAMS